MTQNNKQLLNPELRSLIEEYIRHFLNVRELYMKIEDKAIREEGFTIDSVAILLDQEFREALKRNSSSNNNNNKITSTNNNNNNNIFYPHFQ